MTWQKAYKLPLKEYGGVKVFTEESNMAFDFMFEMFGKMFDGKENMVITDERKQDIIDLVNGTKKGAIEGIVSYDRDQTTINVDGKVLLLVRGWGHLTSPNGLSLSTEKAKEVQDGFANYIVEKLSGK